MTSFASANMYQTLDNTTTDDESANLLTPPELPVDLPTSVFPVEDVAINAPELLDVDEPPIDLGDLLGVDTPPIDLGVDGPRIDLGDGNAISTALRRLDEKWTTILMTYNADLEEKHAYDVEQRRYNEENCDEQRRWDRDEQCLINADLRTVKRLDFEALLVSSKDVFATEMKATFDGFRSELSTWKISINDSMTRNTTTLQAEITAAIDTPAATSLKATVDGLMDTVPTFMQEMRATVSALSDTVKSLEDRVIRSQGQFTKTTLPSLRWRLDILEGCAPQVPQVLVEEPPPAHPPESTSVTPTPRVPAERVHHPAPQSNLASPGLNTGNPGPNAPMAGTPDPLITSRAAYAALRARMSHEAAGETIGHTDGTRLSCGATHEPDNHSPTAPSTRATSGWHVTPHPSTPLPTLQSVPTTNHSRISLSWWSRYRR